MHALCIIMSGIVIDISAGAERSPASPGLAQLGAAPLKKIPSASTNVTIRRVNSRASIAGTYVS
jgi:hypothetical protein